MTAQEYALIAMLNLYVFCAGGFDHAPRHSRAERRYLAATTTAAVLVSVWAAAIGWWILAPAYALVAWAWAGRLAEETGPPLYQVPRRRLGNLTVEILWRLFEVWPRNLDPILGPRRDEEMPCDASSRKARRAPGAR